MDGKVPSNRVHKNVELVYCAHTHIYDMLYGPYRGERMRPMWKGPLVVGLLRLDIAIYKATDDSAVSSQVPLHGIHADCNQRIGQRIYCPSCEAAAEAQLRTALQRGTPAVPALDRYKQVTNIPRGQLLKGYEFAEGQHVIILESELENLPLPALKQLEITDFIKPDAIDPLLIDETYFLGPATMKGKTGNVNNKPFMLLHTVMNKSGMVGLGKFAHGTRDRVAILRPYNEVMLVQTLHYADQLRPWQEIMQPWKEEAPNTLQPREIELGEQLIQNMVLDTFDITQYQDDYVGTLRSLIEAKMAGEPLAAPTIETKQVTVATDLIGQLMASVNIKGERTTKRSFDFGEEKKAAGRKR